jgi:hypothetical protein
MLNLVYDVQDKLLVLHQKKNCMKKKHESVEYMAVFSFPFF